jgi:hypothetical protein
VKLVKTDLNGHVPDIFRRVFLMGDRDRVSLIGPAQEVSYFLRDDGSKTSFRNVMSPPTKREDGQCPIYGPIL